MADEVVEVIYKGWLKKAITTEGKKKSFLNRQSSTWKKRYYVLLRRQDDEEEEESPFLCMYEKEPATESETPKASIKLSPHYRVDKKHDDSGKTFIFEVRTPEDNLRLQAESETNMDLWVFYLQIQTKLRQDFPGYCFEVTPDESNSMRRIGAKGSKCLLHISKWGLTLALKRTRSLLAQWPLKSIRIFESSETGSYSFDAGRSAPMGEARYLFSTNRGEDGRMYDLMDAFTTEMQEQRNDGSTDPSLPATEEEVAKEYEKLRLATFGLLTQRSSSVLSAGTPTASMAVPVPMPVSHSRCPTVGYDHLHRAQEEFARQQSERLPGAVPPRTQGIPIRGNPGHPSAPSRTTGPPLPPRQEGLKNPHSPLQHSYSERGHSLERYGRSQDRHNSLIYREEEPYAMMTPSSTLSRGSRGHRSFTESDMLQMARAGESFDNIIAAEKFRRMLSNNPNASMSEYEAMAIRLGNNPYQNSGVSLLPNSYENTPLISPSPRDGVFPGFPNMGFVSSPQSVESGPPMLPRKYQPSHRTLAAVDVHADASGEDQRIRHTYFQHQFNKGPQSPSSVYMHPSMRAGAGKRPLSDIPGYSSVKGSTLGSHQYQEVYLYGNPQNTLRRSMSVDHFFRIRSHSIRSSISSALSGGSPLIGSLDLATNYAKSSSIPIWMNSRRLPSPPPPGAHTPDFNAYCGSPKAAFPPFADFSAFGAATTPYDEIKGNRNSFNNNNQRQSVGSVSEEQCQMLAASMPNNKLELKENQDISVEDGYLAPTYKMKRSRSEADILDVVQSEDVSAEPSMGKKSQPRARSKSKGFFATLRKRTNSNPDRMVPFHSSGASATEEKPSQSAVASLIKRAQSNPDLLDDKPVSPSRQYKSVRGHNVAAVKPASHLSGVGPVQRRKKFDFSLKIFRQNSKTADKEEGGNVSGGSEDENKSSLSDVKSSRSAEKTSKSPGVKGIVASEKTITFVKVRPHGPAQGQSPSPNVEPTVATKPQSTSPSVPVNAAIPRMQSLSPEETSLSSPAKTDARERLREVANRPLPSPPQNSNQLQRVLSNRPDVKRFTPGMNRHHQVHDNDQGMPNLKTNRVKKTPPPPPPRDPNITLDSVSLKSSNSNASEYENTAVTRRHSTEIGKSPPSSEPVRRISIDNVSLQSSRTNSNGSQYENTDFGSLPAEIGMPPRSLSARYSGSSFDGVSIDQSQSESHRRTSLGSSSLRSSRTNSTGSQHENTDFGSLPAELGTPPGSLSSRTSGISLDGARVARSPSFCEAESRSVDSHKSSRTNSSGSQYENTDFGSLPKESITHPPIQDGAGNLTAATSSVPADENRV